MASYIEFAVCLDSMRTKRVKEDKPFGGVAAETLKVAG